MTAPGRRGNLERRLADLLDRQDVSALLVRFARCLDTKDFTGYADCYAPEGVLQLPRGGHEGRAGRPSTSSAISAGTSPPTT